MSAKKKKPARPSKLERFLTRWRYWIIAGLAIGTYANTIGYGFVLDDAILITENSFTQKGISGLTDIFSYDTFRGFFNEAGKDQLVSGGRYRPLSQAMFALEIEIFGQRPWPMHLINIFLYAGLCLLLFHVVLALAQSRFDQPFFLAFFTAVLFAVHPIHTEVVANIKSRDEILSLLFALSALLLMSKHYRSPRELAGWGSGVLFFLALLAKEMAVTMLLLIPLAGLLVFKKSLWEVGRASAPLVIGFGAYMMLRVAVLGIGLGGDPPLELMNNPFLIWEDGLYRHMTWLEKCPLIFLGLGKYLQLSLFPAILSYDYYPRYFMAIPLQNLWAIASVIVHGVLVIFAFRRRQRSPLLAYGILWYLGTLALVSNLLFPIGTHVAERFLFFPTVGTCLAIAFLMVSWHARTSLKIAPTLLLALMIVSGVARSVVRNPVWESNYTLFTEDVIHTGQSAKARNAAGGELIAYAEQMTPGSEQTQMWEQASKYLTEAISIHPLYKNAYLLRGNAHLYLEKFEEALADYNSALQIDPSYSEALGNRAIAHRTYGRYWGEERQDIEKALEHLLHAYSYLDRDFETVRLLGVAYGNLGNGERAVEFFQKAHEIDPTDVLVVRNLEMANKNLGNMERSEYFRQLADRLRAE